MKETYTKFPTDTFQKIKVFLKDPPKFLASRNQ